MAGVWTRVVTPHLKPYWHRFGGGDWGYQHKAVFHKACKNQDDKRIHIYDELALHRIGAFELGINVAKWWLPDLEGLPDKKIVLAFSPEAFNKTDVTRTRAEQVAEGMKSVLGPYGAFLLKYNDEERAAMEKNPQYAQKIFRARLDSQPKGQMAIALKPANNSRVDGWQYMVELLRFRPVIQETEDEIMARLQATFKHHGVEAYEREVSRARPMGVKEVLPKLQIWKCCKELIRGLEEAIHDVLPREEDVRKFDAIDGVGGDDGLDSGRYTLMNFKDATANMPKSFWVSERLEEVQAEHAEAYGAPLTDPTRLAMVEMTQRALFDKKHLKVSKPIVIPRERRFPR